MIDTLFLDRDGTVIEDGDYLHDPDGIRLIPSAVRAMALLRSRGIRLFIVTNQSGIGRGYFSESDYEACERRLNELLAENGASVIRTAHCPHAPEEHCRCRKPNIGLWKQLAAEYGLSAETCAMAGDKPEDLQFGVNAGFAECCLLGTGKGRASTEKLGLTFSEELTEISGFSDGKALCFHSPDLGLFAEHILSEI